MPENCSNLFRRISFDELCWRWEEAMRQKLCHKAALVKRLLRSNSNKTTLTKRDSGKATLIQSDSEQDSEKRKKIDRARWRKRKAAERLSMPRQQFCKIDQILVTKFWFYQNAAPKRRSFEKGRNRNYHEHVVCDETISLSLWTQCVNFAWWRIIDEFRNLSSKKRYCESQCVI